MSQTKSQSDTDESQSCPICGQPYDHKREEQRGNSPSVRSDARTCKTSTIGRKRTVYIHLSGSDGDGKTSHERKREQYGTLNPQGRLMCSKALERELEQIVENSRAIEAEPVRCRGEVAIAELKFHVDDFDELWPWEGWEDDDEDTDGYRTDYGPHVASQTDVGSKL